MQDIFNVINSINIPQVSQGGGGSSGGGKTQTGSIGSYTPPVVSQGQQPSVPSEVKPVFKDVPENHWAHNYIKKLSDSGVVNGTSDNNFMPDANVTRAEYVKMLVEAFSVSKSSNVVFDDVSSTEWYAPYIAGAFDAGLVNGDGKKFKPNDYITRQDAAVIAYRFAKYFDYKFDIKETTFIDNNTIADYAVESIKALASSKIINGMPDGSFSPIGNATRAQAAKMICEILEIGGVR